MAINRESPEVNAGSMADIAFLLLIFFLVTTTIETDAGLNRMLPSTEETSTIRERNLLRVNLSASNELLVEGELLDIKDLRTKAIAFLDNGGIGKGEGFCGYCKGERVDNSSENPTKAIISLSNTRDTKYGTYVAVQNELVGAYNDLRNREALRLYKVSYTTLLTSYKDSELSNIEKVEIKNRIDKVRNLFPLKLSEAEVNTK